jgi:hypothetical protein
VVFTVFTREIQLSRLTIMNKGPGWVKTPKPQEW